MIRRQQQQQHSPPCYYKYTYYYYMKQFIGIFVLGGIVHFLVSSITISIVVTDVTNQYQYQDDTNNYNNKKEQQEKELQMLVTGLQQMQYHTNNNDTTEKDDDNDNNLYDNIYVGGTKWKKTNDIQQQQQKQYSARMDFDHSHVCSRENIQSYPTYVPRKDSQNRTLIILLSPYLQQQPSTTTTTKESHHEQQEQQRIISKLISENLLSLQQQHNTNQQHVYDIAILYYYINSKIPNEQEYFSNLYNNNNNNNVDDDDVDNADNEYENKKEYHDTNKDIRIKYIWGINVTKYSNDWGIALDEISSSNMFAAGSDGDDDDDDTTSTTSTSTMPSWRNSLMPQVRHEKIPKKQQQQPSRGRKAASTSNTNTNIEYALFGGVRPCYYKMTKFRSNETCGGNGIPILMMYHYVQEKLFESNDDTDHLNHKERITDYQHQQQSILNIYDRYIITQSNLYHLCTHPTIESFNPNYIYTPASTNDRINNVDQFGIPPTHWILSYHHIQQQEQSSSSLYYYNALNFISNLLQYYPMYLHHENLADMSVQRFIRTMWQYHCLLPYHRKFNRTFISTVTTFDSNSQQNSNNHKQQQRIASLQHNVQWKYPGEYEMTQQICSTTSGNTSSITNIPTTEYFISDNNNHNDTTTNLQDRNEATYNSLATAAIENETNYIYPIHCPVPLSNLDENDDDDDDDFNQPLPRNDSYVVGDTNRNTTLVIIMGNLRGGEKVWDTLYRHVLDSNHADLALMIGDTKDVYKNSTMFTRAKYYWQFQEYDDWSIPMDEMLQELQKTSYHPIEDWRTSILPYIDESTGLLGGVAHMKGSGAIIMIIRYLLQKKMIEYDLIHKYDRFIITRADHYYLCDHNIQHLSLSFLYTPNGGSDHYGVTDRHLIVSNRYVLQALDILPTLLQNPKPFLALGLSTMNPERLIRYAWHLMVHDRFISSHHDTTTTTTSYDNNNNSNKNNRTVPQPLCLLHRHRQFERVMFTCGTKHDTTRWQPFQKQEVKEGVQLKYTNEYYSSHQTCKKQTNTK